MSYIDSLSKTIERHSDIESEQAYWRLATDSRAGEILHGFDLAPALIGHKKYLKNPDLCRDYLSSCVDWSNSALAAKRMFDPASNNLKSLHQFHGISNLFLDLLSTGKPRKRQLFKKCMELSFLLESGKSNQAVDTPSSFRSKPSSRQSIKRSWRVIQSLLESYVLGMDSKTKQEFWSRHFPKEYFLSFYNAKDIAFPVVFVDQGGEALTGSMEMCRLWLDVQLAEEGALSDPANLMFFNTPSGDVSYEDRVIGEVIEKTVQEALGYYRNEYLNKTQPLVVRSVFFKVGLPGHQYDGGSIACPAFVATLIRLTGRSLPGDVFYTGQLGCDNNGVQGITEKAIAGWESGYRTFVIPEENLNELTRELEVKQVSHKIGSLDNRESDQSSRIILPYGSINDIYRIWLELTEDPSVKLRPLTRRVHNLPRKNHQFSGREKLIRSIRKGLAGGQSVVALSGLGGIGKTETSIEYAHRYKNNYSLIWYVRGEQMSSIIVSYAKLADKLELPQRETTEEEVIVDAVREWLENHSGWLLIFDNVENPNTLFSDELSVLPQGGGHVLITSRHSRWSDWCEQVTVNTFSLAESETYILKQTGQQNRSDSKLLAKKLGTLPLALTQATSYIRNQKISLKTYLSKLTYYREQLWQEEDAPRNYPHTIAQTWNIVIEKLREEDPTAVDLLGFIAYQAPDDIPLDLLLEDYQSKLAEFAVEDSNRQAALWNGFGVFQKVKGRLKKGKEVVNARKKPGSLIHGTIDATSLNNSLKSLKRYSLVEGNFGSLTVHNLVQLVTQDAHSPRERQSRIAMSLQLCNLVFPENSSLLKNWPICSRLFPHAYVTCENAARYNVLPESDLQLRQKLGDYFISSAQYKRARIIQQKALRIAEKTLPRVHPFKATLFRALGRTLEAMDRLDDAFEMYTKSHNVNIGLTPKPRLEIGKDCNNLGIILLKQGKADEALGQFKKAMQGFGRDIKGRYPLVAECQNNLGRAHSALGNFQFARRSFLKALETAKIQYGDQHAFISGVLNNLGGVNQQLGNLIDALNDHKSALEIDQKIYGKQHPQVAEDSLSIGQICLLKGQYEEADRLFQKASEINTKVFGKMHHSVAINHNCLGRLELAQGNKPAAMDHFRKAMQIAKNVFRTIYHPIVADIANNYGFAIMDQKNLLECRRYLEMALKINQKIFSSSHPSVVSGLVNLGRVCHLGRELDDAKENYLSALSRLRENDPKQRSQLDEIKESLMTLAKDFNHLFHLKSPKTNRLYSDQTREIYQKLKVQGF